MVRKLFIILFLLGFSWSGFCADDPQIDYDEWTATLLDFYIDGVKVAYIDTSRVYNDNVP